MINEQTPKRLYLILALILFLMAIYEKAQGQSPPPETILIVQVDQAIKELTKTAPNRRIHKDTNYRIKIAKMIVYASLVHRIPPLLMTVIIFRESSFNSQSVGSIGERGMAQVHGVAARYCDLTTTQGQISCGARWLRTAKDKCCTWKGALTAYASGKCKAPSKRIGFLVDSRITLWERLKN